MKVEFVHGGVGPFFCGVCELLLVLLLLVLLLLLFVRCGVNRDSTLWGGDMTGWRWDFVWGGRIVVVIVRGGCWRG